MKNRRKNTGSHAKNEENRRNAGFTLIELVVAITVFGILCAAAAVNWASFTKYQNLRSDAHAFHKELMAMKAKAIETGDTIKIKPNTNGYTVDVPGTANKSVGFSNGVMVTNSGWKGTTIIILNENLKAFTNDTYNYTDSLSVELANGTNKAFRILRAPNKVNLELQHKSGGTWKKI